jgi:glycosyltransferase involved in cell wall biosynthesis
MPRVLWLIKGLGRGGAERLLVSMASRFDRDRYEIEIAYVLSWDDAFAGDLTELGIPLRCLGGQRTVEARWPRRLRQLLHDGAYDLIHTHSPVPAVAARVLAPRTARFVHTEHNTWASYVWPTRVGNAATFGRNSSVIAVSSAVASSIADSKCTVLGSRPPVEVLHHGVELAVAPRGPGARRDARRSLGLSADTLVVGMVASFTDRKDHTGLIAAVDQVRGAFQDLVLLLVGSGPLEATLRAEVDRRGMSGQVRFLGSRSDVLDLLPALDVFVLNSWVEGLPISMLEAMAGGLPVIASGVGGVPEALTDGCEGRLVDPSDPRTLVDALADLLHDAHRRTAMGEAGVRRVARCFDLTAAVRRHERLYEEVLR